jgi:hypothetical protein
MQAPGFSAILRFNSAVGTRNAMSAMYVGINVRSKLISLTPFSVQPWKLSYTHTQKCSRGTGVPAAGYPCVSERCGRSSRGRSSSTDASASDRAFARAYSITPCRYRCTGRAVRLALMCCDTWATYASHRRQVNPYIQVHMSHREYSTRRRALADKLGRHYERLSRHVVFINLSGVLAGSLVFAKEREDM